MGSRIIKFRAWRESTKQMLHNVGFHPHLAMDLAAEDEYYETHAEGRWLVSKDIGGKLMQYTGLKDKNGKEIYEGDIVKAKQLIGEIKWDRETAQFVVVNATKRGGLLSFFMESNSEIIGNIYENPELLKYILPCKEKQSKDRRLK